MGRPGPAILRLWTASTLSTQLLCALAAAFALVFLVVHVITNAVEDEHSGLLAEHTLSKVVEVLEKSIRWDAAGTPVAIDLPADVRWLPEALQDDIHYRLVDTAGNIVLGSPRRDEAAPTQAPDGSAIRTTVLALGSAERPYHLHLAITERLLHLLRTQVISSPSALATTVLGLIAVTLIVLIALQRMLKPLRDASAAAATISPSNLHQRLSTDHAPVEIKPLITAFNQALARLEDGFRVQQDFLASAAHELKTPLALIRGQIELEADFSSRDMLLKDVDLMARQVHQLLHLAELSEIQNYRFEEVDVSAVAIDVVKYMERQTAQNRTRLRLLLPDLPVLRTADASALFILLKNLVENAIFHSPPAGTITVAVSEGELSVGDQGAGIRPEHLPKLFTRFWRGPSRTQQGAGLGLSICQEIVLAHRWSIDVRGAEPGTSFVVAFG